MPRPAKSAVLEAEKPQQFDFTKSFQKLKPESFWAFARQYPSWEATSIYVYRQYPIIDRKLGGKDVKYIEVYPRPITEEDLLNDHGSGKYRLIFNDANKPKGLVSVAETQVAIDDSARPPLLEQVELVIGHPQNRGYIEGLKARNLWNKDQEVANGSGSDGKAPTDLSRVLERAIDRIAEKPSDPSPVQNPLEALKEMLQVQQMLQPKTQQADPWEIALKVADLVRKEPRQDPLDIYLKVAELVDKRTPAASAGGDSWVSVAMAFFQALPSLAQMFLAGQMRAAPPSPVPAQPVLIPQQENPASQTIPIPQLIAELKPFLMKSMMQGQSGDEFAAGLVTFLGRDRYDQLAALGGDGIFDQVKAMADIWPMLEPFSMDVKKFIGEFLEFGKPEPEVELSAGGVTQ